MFKVNFVFHRYIQANWHSLLLHLTYLYSKMNLAKFSYIATQTLNTNSPLSEKLINLIVEKIQLQPEDEVLDVGAGKGYVIQKLIRQNQIKATIIEIDEHLTEAIKEPRIDIVNQDARVYVTNQLLAFNGILCIGSSHIFGKYSKAIEPLIPLVKPNGFLLFGETYWKKIPQKEYLDILGISAETFLSYSDNIKLAQASGLACEFDQAVTAEDWDYFETNYVSSIESYCHQHPEDPDCSWMSIRATNMKAVYEEYGRETLGFGLYLFRRGN